jgi:HEPN domain-containing protein
MQNNPTKPGMSGVWLDHARSHLAIARQPKSAETLWEVLCYQAREAVEKALKAVLVAKAVQFRTEKDLVELLNLLESSGIEFPAHFRAVSELNDYLIATEYPGSFEPVTEAEFRAALRVAEEVYAWAEVELKKVPKGTSE